MLVGLIDNPTTSSLHTSEAYFIFYVKIKFVLVFIKDQASVNVSCNSYTSLIYKNVSKAFQTFLGRLFIIH